MQIPETSGGFKDTAKVSTNRRTIRAAVEDPANKTLPTFGRRVERLHVCVTLIGLSKDERRAILKHKCKIPAIYT